MSTPDAPAPKGRWSEVWPAGLFFLITATLFVSPGLVPGRVLSGAAALYALAPWAQADPPDDVRRPLLLLDEVCQHHPWADLNARALRGGEVPWWNPDSACGVPHLGNAQAAPFYPSHLLYVLFPGPIGYALNCMSRLWIAGLGMFLFLRILGPGSKGALVSGMIFQFCGFMGLWIHLPASSVVALLPWTLWALEGWLSRGGSAWWSALALSLGMVLLAGHPETAAHIGVIAAFYALGRSVWAWRREGTGLPIVAGRLAGSAAAALAGLALGAIHWLPFVDYLEESFALVRRTIQAPASFCWQWPVFPQIVLMFFPYALGSQWGDPTDYYGAFFHVENFVESNIGFVGMSGIALAMLGWGGRPRGWGQIWFAVVAALSAAAAWKVYPVYNILGSLPLLKLAGHGRLLFATAFGLAGLAGFGADRLFCESPSGDPESDRSPRRSFARWCVLSAVFLLVILAAGLIVVTVWGDSIRGLVQGRVEALYRQDLGGAGHSHSLEYWQERVAAYQSLARQWFVHELLWSAAALAIVALAARWSGARPRLALGLLLVCTGAELARLSWGFLPAIPEAHYYPKSRIAEWLAEHPDDGVPPRVLVLGGSFPPNVNLMYGFADLRCYDAMGMVRYTRVMMGTGLFDYRHWLDPATELNKMKRPALLDFISARYLIAPPGLEQARWKPVFEADGCVVYENRRAFPRAFLAGRIIRVESPDDALSWVLRPGFDLALATVIEDPASSDFRDVPSSRVAEGEVSDPEGSIPSAARRTGGGLNGSTYEVDAPAGGTLVISQTWDPGWRAWVNGTPAAVQRANVAFCAVAVPPGKSEVTLEFRSARAGMAIGLTLAGCLVVLIGMGLGWRSSTSSPAGPASRHAPGQPGSGPR